MAERKSKRETETIELDSEEGCFVLEPMKIEIGSGYTVALSYDEHDKPIVDIKTYGQVDLAQLRREIERIFPDAEIRKFNQPQSVTVARKSKKRPNTKKK